MTTTWSPGERFQLAARGDRFDGTTGRIRRLWTGGDGREHAHVTHDDGTYTTWPTARLEKPTDSSGDAVTASGPASSDDMKALAADLAHWAEHALVALEPTGLLAGRLRDSINAYRKAVSR